MRAASRTWGVLVIAATLAALAGPSRALEVDDLIGTWHVLIHYRDQHAHNAEALRWDDRVWVFERSGSRLRWIEYPIVVFSDSSGRFERLGSSGQHRVVHAWEPNEGQLAQIGEGLEVNPRGMKSKTLRFSGQATWRSSSAARPTSASVVSYVENWSIEQLATLPIFQREDILGSARSEPLEGITRYTTTEIEPGGVVLRGTFARDGTRRGTFRILRAGAVGGVKGSGKTPGQRAAEAALGSELAQALARRDGELEEGNRSDLEEEEIHRLVEQALRRQGMNPRSHRREVDRLTEEIRRRIVEEGHSMGDIARMVEEGELAP